MEKALNVKQLHSYCTWLQSQLEGAQLQDVWVGSEVLCLQFYRYHDLYLCLDLNQQRPYLALLERKPKISRDKKPVSLFLNSHAENLHLQSVGLVGNDRVVCLQLAKGLKSCSLEFVMVPKSVNLLVKTGEKSISWLKPKELPQSKMNIDIENCEEIQDELASQLGEKWYRSRFPQFVTQDRGEVLAVEILGGDSLKKTVAVVAPVVDPRLKVLQKKKNALLEIDKQLLSDRSEQWLQFGQWLKSEMSQLLLLKLSQDILTRVPVEWRDLYDEKKSLSVNLENTFAQYKHLKNKRQGTVDRKAILQREIDQLELDIASVAYQPSTAPVQAGRAQKIFAKVEVKTRKLELPDGLQAVIGKTAKDNLAILRQAQAWDLWLHLKDYPGSHAIILRKRDQKVSEKIIEQVAKWLFEQSLSLKEKKNQIAHLQKLDVVMVEVRHVKPIKGDKLGRVTYHHPQVFSFRCV